MSWWPPVARPGASWRVLHLATEEICLVLQPVTHSAASHPSSPDTATIITIHHPGRVVAQPRAGATDAHATVCATLPAEDALWRSMHEICNRLHRVRFGGANLDGCSSRFTYSPTS